MAQNFYQPFVMPARPVASKKRLARLIPVKQVPGARTMKRLLPLIAADKGFSLLELLTVVSILATVSAIGVTAYHNVLEESDDRLVLVEMKEIADAIRQFKQDTGYYPKEGPFAVDGSGAGQVTLGSFAGFAGADDAAKTRWFNSPANLIQLFVRPVFVTDSPVEFLTEWDAETGRGWRGPYLRDFNDGYVDIGSQVNEIQLGIGGDPLVVNSVLPAIPDVFAIADPYGHNDEEVSGASVVDDTLLDWNPKHRDSVGNRNEADDRERWGRPYLYFLHDPDGNDEISLISMGPNGFFDNGVSDSVSDEDDIRLVIQ